MAPALSATLFSPALLTKAVGTARKRLPVPGLPAVTPTQHPQDMDPVIVVFGFGIGMLIGMTGMGGGSLMTPLLILVFGIQPVTAVGTDIFYGASPRRPAAGGI